MHRRAVKGMAIKRKESSLRIQSNPPTNLELKQFQSEVDVIMPEKG